tara:strand:- start:334 stop:1497 length:1164 start_codon:yes stop_codon:yes gene_type:complete
MKLKNLAYAGALAASCLSTANAANVEKEKLYTEGTTKYHNVVVIPEIEVSSDSLEQRLRNVERLNKSIVLNQGDALSFKTRTSRLGKGAKTKLTPAERDSLDNLPLTYCLQRENSDGTYSNKIIQVGNDYEISHSELEPGKYRLLVGAKKGKQTVASTVGEVLVTDCSPKKSRKSRRNDGSENTYNINVQNKDGPVTIVTADGATLGEFNVDASNTEARPYVAASLGFHDHPVFGVGAGVSLKNVRLGAGINLHGSSEEDRNYLEVVGTNPFGHSEQFGSLTDKTKETDIYGQVTLQDFWKDLTLAGRLGVRKSSTTTDGETGVRHVRNDQTISDQDIDPVHEESSDSTPLFGVGAGWKLNDSTTIDVYVDVADGEPSINAGASYEF